MSWPSLEALRARCVEALPVLNGWKLATEAGSGFTMRLETGEWWDAPADAYGCDVITWETGTPNEGGISEDWARVVFLRRLAAPGIDEDSGLFGDIVAPTHHVGIGIAHTWGDAAEAALVDLDRAMERGWVVRKKGDACPVKGCDLYAHGAMRPRTRRRCAQGHEASFFPELAPFPLFRGDPGWKPFWPMVRDDRLSTVAHPEEMEPLEFTARRFIHGLPIVNPQPGMLISWEDDASPVTASRPALEAMAEVMGIEPEDD